MKHPKRAISIRQPWAWAIVHAGKDIENRSTRNWTPGPVAIHAAKGMTKLGYNNAQHMMSTIGVKCPPPADLLRGGIIGTANISHVISESDSPWFLGPFGLKLTDAKSVDFIASKGSLGLFSWEASADPEPAEALKWMRKVTG